jgi:hypothetical protein
MNAEHMDRGILRNNHSVASTIEPAVNLVIGHSRSRHQVRAKQCANQRFGPSKTLASMASATGIDKMLGESAGHGRIEPVTK